MSHRIKVRGEDPDLNKMLQKYLRNHFMAILISVGIIVFLGIVIPGITYYKGYIDRVAMDNLDKGLALFEKARLTGNASSYVQSQAAFQKVITSYALSSSTPTALLYMANAFYQQGNYLEARRAYTQFMKKYSKNLLAGAAQLGLAMSAEMSNEYESAVVEYQKLKQSYPLFASEDSKLAEARCLEELKRWEEAKKIYGELAPKNFIAKKRLNQLLTVKKA